jgi:hypothetical protein
MQINIKPKHVLVFFLTFCVFRVLSADNKKESRPLTLVQTLQNSDLLHMIVDFLLPYEAQLVVKPLNKFFYHNMNTDPKFRTKLHTFMFEQIIKLPTKKPNSNHDNDDDKIFTMVTKFIRFYPEEFCPDIESICDSKVKEKFEYSKNKNQIGNRRVLDDKHVFAFKFYYSFIDQNCWFRENLLFRTPRYPVCFLITDQESKLYLLRMSDVITLKKENNQNFKFQMLVKQYSLSNTFINALPQDIPITMQESVTIEFDFITNKFQFPNNTKYSPLKMLYWEDNVNNIGRAKYFSCRGLVFALLYQFLFTDYEIAGIIAGLVFALLYQFLFTDYEIAGIIAGLVFALLCQLIYYNY